MLISATAVVYPAPLIPLTWAIVPLLGVVMFIIGIIVVALNQPQLSALALPIIIVVVLHNLLGLAGGYVVPKALGLDPTICRTIAIEVGMQNSGLAVALTSFWSRTGRPR
ncbi:hypothetical protein [Candidatus Methylomirabilis sp.]|uniref:hypothetical protein n=1 Tax=Candidatus Methylomirabilis sp. TaxID=2032687 RepID=UPI002A63417D|nr:hypothetical protein [Candidatus Methylomirabilis sp.]